MVFSRLLKQYLQESGISKYSKQIKLTNANSISKALSYQDSEGNKTVKVGDVIFFDFDNDGKMDYAGIITKITNGEIYYSGASSYRTNELLSKHIDGNTVVYITPIEDESK